MHGTSKVAGVLLTGGASRRMGFDKALVEVDGRASAVRLAAVMQEVANPVLEVGPGRSGLPAIAEGPVGQGPFSPPAPRCLCWWPPATVGRSCCWPATWLL